MGDECLADIWREDLAHGLLWERIGEYEFCTISTSPEWIAPSWSWASTGHTVIWDSFRRATDINITLLNALRILSASAATATPQANCEKHVFMSKCAFSKSPARLIKRFEMGPKTDRNQHVLEVVLAENIYPGFLTFASPDEQMRFFALRNPMPESYGQTNFMPLAPSPVEARTEYTGTA